MRPEDRVRLQHMLEAADTAIQFMQGRDRLELDQDRMLLFAVVRVVEVLGEAASRVSPDARELHRDLPRRAATSMRNRLIHGYFDIDRDILWATVTVELPALVETLSEICTGLTAFFAHSILQPRRQARPHPGPLPRERGRSSRALSIP